MAAAPHTYACFGGVAAVDAQLVQDARALSAAPAEAFSAILRAALAFLDAPAEADLYAALEGVVAAHGLKAKPLKSAARTLLLALAGAAKHRVGQAEVAADLTALGLDAARASEAAAAYGSVTERLVALAVDRAMEAGAGGSGALLRDAEWRFGVTVSSDEVGRIGSTFLQMKLLVEEPAGGGGGTRLEHLELSIPQFYALLADLERAKSYVDYLGGSAS